jgi:ubiquinone biosynthesis protein
LRDQWPTYVKILPELPRLMADYLQSGHNSGIDQGLSELIQEQKRTNRLLRGMAWGAVAFGGTFLFLQWLLRWHFH